MDDKAIILLSKQGFLCGEKIGKLDFYKYYVFGKKFIVKFNSTIHRTKNTVDNIHYDL